MKIVKTKTQSPSAFKKVEMREPTVKDMIEAQRTSGAVEGAAYEAALLSQICTFDGKLLPMEDVAKISMDDFFSLKDSMLGGGLTKLVQQFLASAGKQDSDPKQS
jgi:hypothetical protein